MKASALILRRARNYGTCRDTAMMTIL